MSWLRWDQAGIDLEGSKKRAAESTTRSDTESEEESDGEPNGLWEERRSLREQAGHVEQNGAGRRTDEIST